MTKAKELQDALNELIQRGKDAGCSETRKGMTCLENDPNMPVHHRCNFCLCAGLAGAKIAELETMP